MAFDPQAFYTSKTTDVSVTGLDGGTTLSGVITSRSANHQLYVQKITFSPTTYAACDLTFQGSDKTNKSPIGKLSIPAAASAFQNLKEQFVLDFGTNGVPLVLGKNLDVVFSAASGLAGNLHIEAYERLGKTINTTTSSTAN